MLMTTMTTTAMHVHAACGTHHGGRTVNQDRFIVEPHLGLYAVLDGMGGAAAGEIAAQLAQDALVEFMRKRRRVGYSRRELLQAGIDYASATVHHAALASPAYAGMGSTVVACLIEQHQITIGHAGDSRAYLLRDGLHLLTRDHNQLQAALDTGYVPDATHRRYLEATLTRNLGEQPGAEADMFEMALQAGDRLLLCSDGLSNCLSEEMIERVLALDEPPDELAMGLVQMAVCSTARDNVTALVITLESRRAQLEHADTGTDAA